MTIDVAATSRRLLLGYTPVEDPEEGLERYQPRRFDVKYSLFRAGHFTNRIVTLDEKVELPTGSILHVFDNISHPEDPIDIPRVDESIFVKQESLRKFIHHITEFDHSVITQDEKYIYRTAGIATKLAEFRSKYGSKFRPLTDISTPSAPTNSLVVINHNPLFRVRVMGRLKYYRRINLILSSILNTATKLATAWEDRRQYIVIPWNSETYGKDKFFRNRYKLTPQTIFNSESFHYIVMMHLVNYMWPDATTSMLNKLPDEALGRINIVLQAGSRAVIFNLLTIRDLNEHGRYYVKFVNQLNVLAATNHLESDEVPEEYKEKIRTALTTTEDAPDDTTDEIPEYQLSVPEVLVEDNPEVVEEDDTSTAVNGMVPLTQISTSTNTPIQTLVKVKDILTSGSNDTAAPVRGAKPETIVEADTEPVTNIEPTEEVLTLDSTMQFMDETMTAADDFIDHVEHLSPKAKARYKAMARSYEKLQLDGVPLTKILSANGAVVIDPEDTAVKNDVGILPDESSRKTTLRDFDKQYLKHTANKHMVSTLLSFQRSGVFLTDLSVEKNVDEMNHTRTYVAKYTDINGKRSTVKFTMPVVESDDRIRVDGVRQVLKKQRLNLPIVKISETEVSLATNQNKTRVIRNTTQAHSFYTKVEDLINSSEVFEVVYGSATVNQRISYEYATLAKHLRSVSWLTTDRISVSLDFSYYTRHEHADIAEEDLLQYEAIYGGIYVGRYGSTSLYIDKENRLLGVRDGKEDPTFPYDSLLDLLYNSVETTKKLNLSEWVSVKMLDKMMPVIFVVACRYGLRESFRQLGIEYTITEPRSKTIIGGSSIANVSPATEGVLKKSSDIAGTEDIASTKDSEEFLKDLIDGDFSDEDELLKDIGLESLGVQKYEPKATDIQIRLADASIWFSRYPLKHSLVAAGLANYDLREFTLADLEAKDAYFDILTKEGLSINYLRGIESFFDLFVDPITHNVLVGMNMPTTVIGLLYKSAEMLSTLDHRNPSSRYNHRIRGYEQFNAILYNEMARQFAKYQSQRNRSNAFSINPDAVYLRIIQNASMMPSDAANPLQDLKEKASMTYSGVGGRTSESFVVEDRRYSKDDIGVISESTVDNGKVGIVAQLTYNPALGNTLGILNPKEVKDLDPSNCLSITALTYPFSINDDMRRCNFINIQSTHMMPTKQVDQSRVRTGYERMLSHMVSRDYVGTASNDGVVTVVDEDAGMVEVKYEDGARDVFRIGHTYNEFENFEVDQHLVPTVKVGQKVKKNEVVCYNRGFFNYDPISRQADFSIGVRATVALMETDQTLEDSTAISKRLSEAMTLAPIHTKYIALNRNSLILNHKSVDDHVRVNDPLMVFDEDPVASDDETTSMDETTMTMLNEFAQHKPKAGHEGRIINIEAFTGCKISEMSPSVAKLFKRSVAAKQARANIAKGSTRSDEFVPSTIVTEGSKYHGVTFDKDTVLFVYRIQESIPQDKGDKMVVCNQLKCTVAGVFTKPTRTAGGEEIDVIFSTSGVCRRICTSPFFMGIASRAMEKVQNDFIAIARKQKK